MKEIGGEFWGVPITEKKCDVFPENTQWFLSGRSALQAIINQLPQVHSVALPSWCCDSMIKPFLDAGIAVKFYPVYWSSEKNKIIQEVDLSCDVLFLMDYFGYRCNTNVKHPLIIRDLTHSIFSGGYDDADYYFGSLRKWCGFYTGGFAWTKNGKGLNSSGMASGYISCRRDAMKLKCSYINKNARNIMADAEKKEYLDIFRKAETMLENSGVEPAAARDIELVDILDVDYIRRKRRENAGVLMNAFKGQLMFPKMKEQDCPLFVPIKVSSKKRNELKRYLIANDIYCPVHWELSKYHEISQKEKNIYDTELSLICDQRYTEREMYHIIDAIKKFGDI